MKLTQKKSLSMTSRLIAVTSAFGIFLIAAILIDIFVFGNPTLSVFSNPYQLLGIIVSSIIFGLSLVEVAYGRSGFLSIEGSESEIIETKEEILNVLKNYNYEYNNSKGYYTRNTLLNTLNRFPGRAADRIKIQEPNSQRIEITGLEDTINIISGKLTWKYKRELSFG